MSIVNELLTQFSFAGSTQPLAEFNQRLSTSIKRIGALTAVSLGLITITNKNTSEMAMLAESVGLTTEKYQAYGEASLSLGMSGEVVSDMLEEMNNKFGESSALLASGKKPLGAVTDSLKILGLAYKDIADLNPDEQFEAIAEAIAKMPNSQQAASAADILFGGDANKFFSNLKKTGKSLDDLVMQYQEINMLTEEGVKGSKEYTKAFRFLQISLTSSSREIAGIIGSKLAPSIEKMTSSFAGWAKENKEWIGDTAKKLGSAIVGLGEFLVRMKGVIFMVAIPAFVAFKIATLGLAGALGLLFSPVIIFMAVVSGALLIIDDLMVAFKGGKSIIRDFILEWTGFDIRPMLQEAVKMVAKFGKLLKDKLIKDFEQIKSFVAGVFRGIGTIWLYDFNAGFDKLLNSAKEYVALIKNAFANAFDFIGDKFDSIIGKLPTWMGGDEEGGPQASGASALINPYESGANLAQQSLSSAISNVTQTNEIKVYSSDPQAAGQSVADFSTKQLRDTTNSFSRGGQ